MDLRLTARSTTQDADAYAPLDDHGLTSHVRRTAGTGAADDPFVDVVEIRNAGSAPWSGVVRVDLPFAPRDPRFFLPGFLYGRNRGEAPLRTRHEWPRLVPDGVGGGRRPAASSWMTRGDRLSHPVALVHDGGRVRGLSAGPHLVRTPAGALEPWAPGVAGGFAQHAGFTCALTDGSVGWTLGYEHAPWKFVQALNVEERPPLEDGAVTLAAGESVRVSVRVFDYAAQTPAGVYAAVEHVYDLFHTPPRPGADPLTAVGDLAGAVHRDAWLPALRQYACFVYDEPDGLRREPLPSTTWTNGLSVAAPMLVAGLRLGDDDVVGAARSFVDRVVAESLNPASGLPYESWRPDGWTTRGWWYDDLATGGHSGYHAGQTVYWVLRAYQAERRLGGRRHDDWLAWSTRVVEVLERGRNGDDEYPYVLSERTGAGIEYDALGSSWCVAAGALLASITQDHRHVAGLSRAAQHYHDAYVARVEGYGGPLDTEKAVDSEGVIGHAKGLRYLHETTGDPHWLDLLDTALRYESTFRFCYDTPVQVPPLSAVGWSSCGGTITSTANPHVHPMGSYLVDEMLYLVGRTGSPHLRSRLADTVAWGLQTYSRHDGEYGYGRRGWVSERFCHSDGLLVQRYPDGSPASTWFALMPWSAACLLDGLVGDWWDAEVAGAAVPGTAGVSPRP